MTYLVYATLAVAALLLSGCTGTSEDQSGLPADSPPADSTPQRQDPSSTEQEATPLRLRGHVLSASLQPISNATVTVVGLGVSSTTKGDGAFDFGTQERRLYTLMAKAQGFEDASLTVPPDLQGQVRLIMQAGDPVTAYNTTVHFRGILQCAFEALIISPSCDSALVALNDALEERAGERPAPQPFDQNFTFLFGADRGWKTLVLDIIFDDDAHPGLDGLRIAVRGSLDPDGSGEYTQYGRWHDAVSFTARLEPGGTYTDGTEPVPASATGFQVDVYPHSHAYHPAEQGFLGVGFAQNVRFDVFATLFYVDSAPEGWSFQETTP